MGNDVEDEAGAPPLPKEIVKKTSSSKKLDVPPPKADPAKAKKNKKPLGGNEAALKNKNNNKDVSAPSSTPANRYKKPFDRQSRSGKTDSKKKVKQGWGGDDSKKELDDETNATGDAVNELAEEAAEKNQPAPPAAKSLQDYLAELQATEAQLAGKRTVRVANDGNNDKWGNAEKIEKKSEEFIPSTIGKKQKQKQAKDKKFLDFSAVFADEVSKPRSGPKGKNGGKNSSKPAVVNEHNFPKLS